MTTHPLLLSWREAAVDPERKILRVCATLLLCVVLVRAFGNLSNRTDPADVAAAIIFLGTGRVVRQEEPTEAPTEEAAVTEPEQTPVRFYPQDAALVAVGDYADTAVDVEQLLLKALDWELAGAEPTVLVLHTHASESYENTEGYTASSDYRCLDEAYNVISVGAHLAELLSRQGICVLHDKTLHDYPSYNGSYNNSRQTLSGYLQAYPSIRLVLDIHRDAMTDDAGNQIGYTQSTEKGTAAKVMLVVGCNNDAWEENAALAVKLQVLLEKEAPGICRPLTLRQSRFNQDLSSGAILIEMGAAGNTRQEALLAAEYVAEAIVALSKGTK